LGTGVWLGREEEMGFVRDKGLAPQTEKYYHNNISDLEKKN